MLCVAGGGGGGKEDGSAVDGIGDGCFAASNGSANCSC
jgi:hypothetical protein